MNDPSYSKNMDSVLTLSELRYDLATAVLAMGDLFHLIGRTDLAKQLVGAPQGLTYLEHVDPETVDLTSLEAAQAMERLYRVCFEPKLGIKLGAIHDDLLTLEGLIGALPSQFPGESVNLPRIKKRLDRLHSAGSARRALALMARSIAEGNIGEEYRADWTLIVDEIAAIAQMDERSVRNKVGPAGRTPLRSLPHPFGMKRLVLVDGFEAFGWLIGRRMFRPVPLDPGAFQKAVANPVDRHHLGMVLGILGWSNIGPTNYLAKRLGWMVGEVDGWIKHGPTKEEAKARKLAVLLGLDPDALAASVVRLGR
ncbi:hypothetical protein [Azospirillum sp. A29]|uniref:hypothetical protein n=1 Tax=unclassified Azospirillum TaxID=2630922 RepID=UPI0036701990